MVKVYYNGIDAFSDIAATPFIGINDEIINYAQRWGVVQNISLNGMITGDACGDSFNGLIQKQQQLFNNFSQDFKEIQIIESGKCIFSGQCARIKSIDFDQSAYFGGVNFKLSLDVYPQSLFSGAFGVIDPVADIKYTEQKDGTVNITRNFSAKGFNTSSISNNALENARSYVQSLTGSAQDIVPPKFISLSPTLSNLSPRKISENINRMESTYSVDIEYALRKGSSKNSVLKYTVDVSYDDEKGIYNVSLKGNLTGGEYTSIEQLRQDFASFRPFDLTFHEFKKITNYNYLNPQPDSQSINENDADGVIDFTYEYTSDPQKIKFDYTIDLNNEYITDQTTVNFNGTFTARGPQKTRMQNLEQEILNFNVVPLCQKFYLENATNSSLPMNTNFKSYKVNRDFNQSTINIQASFDNSQFPPYGFKSFTWNIAITPSLNRYNPIQFLNGDNGYFDLNYYNRGKITIQGSAVVSSSNDFSERVRNEALQILNLYASNFSNRVRIEDKVDRKLKAEDNGYLYNFNISDSCETPIFVI